MHLTVLMFMASAMVGATTAAQAADACGPLKLFNRIQMTGMPGDSGLDLVPITINGVEQHFLFDTGGTLTQIGQAAAKSLKLSVSSSSGQMVDLRGKSSNQVATVPQFVLGNQHGMNTHFPVSPMLGGDKAHPPFDGIFALNYLADFDVEVDFGTDMLNVFSPDHCPGHVVYWRSPAVAIIPFTMKDWHITLPVMLDGQEVTALIDTGASYTAMRVDIATAQYKLAIGAADTPEHGMLNGDAALKTYSHVFDTLSFGGVAIAHPHVTIIPNAMVSADQFSLNAPQMIIGMDVLRKLHIYFAFGERKMYVSPATGPVAKAGP